MTAIIAAVVISSIFECLPVTVASTTPASNPSPFNRGRAFFGRITPFKTKEVTKLENEEDIDESDEKDDDEEEDASAEDVDDEEEDDKEKDDESQDAEKEEKDDEKKEEEKEKEETDTSTESKGNQTAVDPKQVQQNQLLRQSPFLSPGTIVYRSAPSPYGNPMQRPQVPGMPGQTPGQTSDLVVVAVANLLSVATRLFVLKWIIGKLAFENEAKSPVQHFMWECLNDKFVKDDEIWNRVLNRPPKSMGLSQRKWENTVKATKSDVPKQNLLSSLKKKITKKKTNKKTVSKNEKQLVEKSGDALVESSSDPKIVVDAEPKTEKTVVVMDFSTMDTSEPEFLRFADIVTFLVGSNSPKKQQFGKDPEIILKVLSPGGEVTSFAFAAAQVARLRNAGWKVTVCVDRIAASGGYMIASQATQILASPFAMVGSVGVITQSLNYYEILKKYGIKSLVLKAGDSKNPITDFGEITDQDIETTQIDLNETHESFIELCRSNRPMLDPKVCNGRILSGNMALESGMIDRILTSDEYILEKISDGDLVMKLHLVSGDAQRFAIWNALQILPHLKHKFQRLTNSNNNIVGRLNAAMDGNVVSKAVQIWGITSMIRRAVMRPGSFQS